MKGHYSPLLDVDGFGNGIVNAVITFFDIVAEIGIVITDSTNLVIEDVHLQFHIVNREAAAGLLG
jgi:hypothetical protein